MTLGTDLMKRFSVTSLHCLKRNQAINGFSLIEVMMIMALMSTIIIPFIMLMTQVTMTSRGTYIQSSRSLVLNNLMDEMSPERRSFYSAFDCGGTKITTATESGQVLPYQRRVDSTASDSMKRTTYFYLYNNASDADASPRYRTTLTQRVDFVGLNEDALLPQTDGPEWAYDLTYDATRSKSGMTTTTGGVWWYDGAGFIDYINANDYYKDLLFSWNWVQSAGTTIEERFNVTNGAYNVKIYFSNNLFADQSVTVNDTTNRILMDIYLEGTAVQTGYSPYETMKAIVSPSAVPTNSVSAVSYDVAVTDGVLNVELRPNASTYYPPYITAITVQRRRSQ